ncbi:MAG: aminopeptidase P family protein [Actinomycetota bacterium]|nr:aminopeptidase P family protein [Actinomycetota bacterium]
MPIPSALTLSDPLPAMETAGRLGRLAVALGELCEVDGLVVSSLINIRYLTGFTGSAGLLLVLGGEATLVTDGRYADQSEEQLTASGVTASIGIAGRTKQAALVSAAVAGAGVRRLGLEAAHVSWATQRRYATDWFDGVELEATVGLVEGLRRSKDAGELARIRRAATIADAAFADIRPMLTDGPAESDVALELDSMMRRLGATGPSFETIVATGPNAAMPHHRPGGRRIGIHDAVVVDFGALVDGYASDMTRTVSVEGVVSAELRRAVSVVTEAQRCGVAAVAAGVDAADVDRACRDVIAEAGWSERFVHGTGHGVGLDIHEAPSVAATSTDTLAAGHVVTVEPGVYLPGLGGVRIEDTVVVTADGCEPLTLTPKDLC